jgi:epoxide hydrolase 4
MIRFSFMPSFLPLQGEKRQAQDEPCLERRIAMIQHGYAQVNGIRLHYVSAGSGPLLLFLHGFPDFWYLWNDQIAHFSQSYHVVAPDLRGYNLSDKPADVAQYRLPLIVEDIRALIDQLGQRPMILAGHDWGGVVAWEFAARYQAYLNKLVILSTAPLDIIRRALRDPERRQEWMYQLMVICPQAEQILRAGDYYLFDLTVFGANAEVPPGYFTDADRAAYHHAWAQPGAISGGVNYYRAAGLLDYFSAADRQSFLDTWTHPDWKTAGERFFDGLQPTDVFGTPTPPPADERHDDVLGQTVLTPTLMIVGEKEGFALTDRFDWFERRVPHGRLIRVPNSGHRIIHEQSALVSECIQRFIEYGKA